MRPFCLSPAQLCCAVVRTLPPAVFAAVLAAFAAAAVRAQDRTATAATDWWAYRPLVRPVVPNVGVHPFVRTDLDRFVLHDLRAQGLEPSPPASRAALIRRLTFDLTGLPPTPEDVAAFVQDQRDAAYAELVDRLLASPQYGVKWGRHWLDLVRYAETNSFERDSVKPAVWRYRDWVVDAFNSDLPYGEFLTQQLAGDEIEGGPVSALVATGFYRLGLWDDEPTEPLQAVYDDFDSIADTAARSMLAMSMGCARCHDHKKDPIKAKDYYAFLSFFEGLAPYRPTSGGTGLSVEHFARRVPPDGALAAFEQQRAAFLSKRSDDTARIMSLAAEDYGRLDAVARVQRLRRERGSLVARYALDRSDSSKWLDEVAGQHGLVEGQVVPVEGHRGLGGRFDGDDCVVLPLLVHDSFTITLRLKTTHHGPGREDDQRWFTGTGLVDGEVSGIVRDFGLAWHDDGRVVAGTGDPETFVSGPSGYADGQWHHVAFTRDRGTGRIGLYCDGVLVDEAIGSTQKLDAPPRLVVGRMQPGGAGFRGDLDDVCFHSRALSAAEVFADAMTLPGGIVAAESASLAAAMSVAAGGRPPELATIEVLCARERGATPEPSFVRVRGDARTKGEAVEPAFPWVLGAAPPAIVPPKDGRSSGRRTALARWITAADNQLTWRVIANRLFQYHMGRGIVRSANDFGRLGDLPTHPLLLDWLACEVLERGQSLKAMHRLLVSSGTYMQACAPDDAKFRTDPLNDRLWRFDRRRLTAEEVRDSMLAVAGVINVELGGESVFPPLPPAVLATASRPDEAWGTATKEQAARRSLYVHVKRSLLEPLLSGFDMADTDSSCPVRYATVQPTQALMLLNGDFAHQTARQFAERLQRESSDVRARVERGLWLALQRPPVESDVERLCALAADLQRDFGKTEAEALQRVCLLLLNCNEFLYLD